MNAGPWARATHRDPATRKQDPSQLPVFCPFRPPWAGSFRVVVRGGRGSARDRFRGNETHPHREVVREAGFLYDCSLLMEHVDKRNFFVRFFHRSQDYHQLNGSWQGISKNNNLQRKITEKQMNLFTELRRALSLDHTAQFLALNISKEQEMASFPVP